MSPLRSAHGGGIVSARRCVGVLPRTVSPEAHALSFGPRTVVPMKTIKSTFKRWHLAHSTGDAAVMGAVVLASVALTFLGI